MKGHDSPATHQHLLLGWEGGDTGQCAGLLSDWGCEHPQGLSSSKLGHDQEPRLLKGWQLDVWGRVSRKWRGRGARCVGRQRATGRGLCPVAPLRAGDITMHCLPHPPTPSSPLSVRAEVRRFDAAGAWLESVTEVRTGLEPAFWEPGDCGHVASLSFQFLLYELEVNLFTARSCEDNPSSYIREASTEPGKKMLSKW